MLGSRDGRALHGKDARSARSPSVTLSEFAPTDDDWYLNLVWIERQKCLLLTHTGTLFSVLRAGIHVADLRPLGNYLVDAIHAELGAEGLPTDTFSQLEPENVQLAKTASRSTLGFMTEMAFELGWIITDKGGLHRADCNALTTPYAGCSGTAATTSARSNSSTNASTREADHPRPGLALQQRSVAPHIINQIQCGRVSEPTGRRAGPRRGSPARA